ncbi:hypothetical protein J2T57_001626 [Natronocella acetinitrilica]|uniref:RES domain-containing protein n=1 Tax=Natronocella acetinitrilica TaxID=414046 RepID=A0AAE3KB90_9GAMM|nr:RES family NAD+ phosphorylase [Natronocella acetinitrilica]MCP1674524.1 hypothetical protein [Natronocella acetinitrilica]
MGDILNDASLFVADEEMVRNIVSLRESQDVFDDLSDDPVEQRIAIDHEMAIKPEEYRSNQPIIDRPFEESAWFNAVAFPFENWAHSRFSAGGFGVWYGAPKIETTVYETVHHWRNRLLTDAEGFLRPGIIANRRVYHVHCEAALVDLRPFVEQNPALVDKADYTFTQALGARLQREGHPGLLSRSARCAGDICAIFNQQVLSDPMTACYLTYTTTERGVVVEREIGNAWMVVA